VAALIGDDRWLLVLDSFEHVSDAARELGDLLGRCPRLTVLATSRTPLRLRAEHVQPLTPLSVPPPAETDPAVLAANPAVRLLVQRAAEARPGFTLTSANAATLAQLCRRLDGLPLAIELTATRLSIQEPHRLLAELTTPHPGAPQPPDSHDGLRRTVEWCVQRLAGPEQHLLGVLAVFAGGAAPDAVGSLLDNVGLAVGDLHGPVAHLAAARLIAVVDRAGAARITMPGPVREAAADLLTRAGLDIAVRRAHAQFFLARFRDPAAFADVDTERDNTRAAVRWAVTRQPDLLDVAVVRGLTAYHLARAQFAEAERTLRSVAARDKTVTTWTQPGATAARDEAVAARAQPGATTAHDETVTARAQRGATAAYEDAVTAWALHGAAVAAHGSGRAAEALSTAHESGTLFAKLGDGPGQGAAMSVAGDAQRSLGRYADARASHLAALEVARAAADRARIAICLSRLGALAHDQDDYDTAQEHYRAALAIEESLGDDQSSALTRIHLAAVENELGAYTAAHDHLLAAVASPTAYAKALLSGALLGLDRPAEAQTAAEEALELARAAEDRPGLGLALARLGDLALARGDHAEATGLLLQALEHADGRPEQARALDRLALARAAAAPAEAARFRERAANIRQAIADPVTKPVPLRSGSDR
jgi:predicted ATPase/tetratricopeptide (TPR) repeat protein